jgi:hypothetical protein
LWIYGLIICDFGWKNVVIIIDTCRSSSLSIAGVHIGI